MSLDKPDEPFRDRMAEQLEIYYPEIAVGVLKILCTTNAYCAIALGAGEAVWGNLG